MRAAIADGWPVSWKPDLNCCARWTKHMSLLGILSKNSATSCSPEKPRRSPETNLPGRFAQTLGARVQADSFDRAQIFQ